MGKIAFAFLFILGLLLLALTIYAEHGFIIGGACP